MEAINQEKIGRQADSKSVPVRYIPAMPTLFPGMMITRARSVPVFPLEAPGVYFYYFARNAVWTLARILHLDQGETLVPAYHHGVEIEALLDAGAVLRYYRVGPKMQVDPDDIAKKITSKTRAIYLIHYLGFPGPVEQVRKIADEHHIAFIEDCALALLSKLDERPLGTFGDASIFSLYKTLPVPNGGALCMNSGSPLGIPESPKPPWTSTFSHLATSLLQNYELRLGGLARGVRRATSRLGDAANVTTRVRRIATGTQHFEREHANLGMSSISRKIAWAQDFARIVENRRRNYFFLLGQLREIAPPIFTELSPGVCPLFFPLYIPRKEEVMASLARRGVEAINFWSYGDPSCPIGEFPDVDDLRRKVLEIPIHQDLDPLTMTALARAVKDSVHEVLHGS